MRCISWRVDGDAARLSEARATGSLTEAMAFLPEGAYTTLRTYGGTGLLHIDDHLTRLEESAELLGHPFMVNRSLLRRLLCEVLRGARWEVSNESRVRLTLDCAQTPGDIWFSLEPLVIPSAEQYRDGVAVLTQVMYRENPKAKNSAFLTASQTARARIVEGINEVLMVGPEGMVLEGLSSNFFGIHAGTLITAEEGVLPGITRSLILDEAAKAGIPIRLEALSLDELATLDEAFISSTSRAVLPVVAIDGRPVGTGVPGSLTTQLAARYQARLNIDVQSVCDPPQIPAARAG